MPARIPYHKPFGQPTPAQSARQYNAARDPEIQKIYNSTRWKKIRALKLGQDPLCAPCLARGETTVADRVHHLVEIRDDPASAYDFDNLQSICMRCHNALHHRKG
jgi:5-methylcytosine-specific restriction enzyme A